jgi:hypothetical protein
MDFLRSAVQTTMSNVTRGISACTKKGTPYICTVAPAAIAYLYMCAPGHVIIRALLNDVLRPVAPAATTDPLGPAIPGDSDVLLPITPAPSSDPLGPAIPDDSDVSLPITPAETTDLCGAVLPKFVLLPEFPAAITVPPGPTLLDDVLLPVASARVTDPCGPALPNDVLLKIFDFYRAAQEGSRPYSWWPHPKAWYTLTHVCQRWRYIVFASPRCLKLCLLCTGRTPVREMLDISPPFPIEISSSFFGTGDNIIAALEHRDRVHLIFVDLTGSKVERFMAVVEEPFPALTYLHLRSKGQALLPLPITFFGGSAPSLQKLWLERIPFPGLPKFLLSTSDLVELELWQIPNTGYISPEAMVTGLSALTRLQTFIIHFESPAPRLHRRNRLPPPLTRTVLPALTYFQFRGVSEYLEDLVAQIDAPQLQRVIIKFFNQLVFDIRQLPWFISHARTLRPFDRAKVAFSHHSVEIGLRPLGVIGFLSQPRLEIRCRGLDWQVSSMAQICSQLSFLLSSVEQLDIFYDDPISTLEDVNIDNTQWLELFQPFTAVRTLHISQDLKSFIVSALQKLTGEQVTEVLPALSSLYLQGHEPSRSEQKALEPFITARQTSNHPVTIWPLGKVRDGK